MSGLVIFLSTILAIFAVATIVLVVLIVSVSRKIARTEQNAKTIWQRVRELSDIMTVTSSVVALIGGIAGKINVIRAKKRSKTHGKKENSN